jgi:hypothetical protein
MNVVLEINSQKRLNLKKGEQNVNKTNKLVFCLLKLIVLCIICFNTAMLVASQNPAEKSEPPPISIYDEGNLLVLSLEDTGKYHGDICPCVVVAFRATKLAISQLWKDEIPRREEKLIRRYGEEYKQYREQVPNSFPGFLHSLS